jgi:hemerythrin-like domain-containing protein
VIDLITAVRRDHRKAREMVDRLAEISGEWPIHERAIRKTILSLVALEAAHEAAEARYLWPVVRDCLPEYAEIRELALVQERQARRQLHTLHKAAGTKAGADLVPGVVQALRIHIGLEDAQILPALESSLSRKESLRLGPQFEQALRTGPTRPHPRTPAIPGVLAVVTPLARRTDRLRDFLRLR